LENIENNGIIQESGEINMDIYGDIINNGTWLNKSIDLNG